MTNLTPADLDEGRRLLVNSESFDDECDLIVWLSRHASALIDAARERDELRETVKRLRPLVGAR